MSGPESERGDGSADPGTTDGTASDGAPGSPAPTTPDGAVDEVHAGWISRHPIVVVSVFVLLVAGAAAAFAVSRLFEVPAVNVPVGLPTAPQLTPHGQDEIVYRIDASRSSVGYEVDEQLAGSSHTATGTTKALAGDILVDSAHPEQTKVGQIVVNVQQLRSDQELRDRRLQRDFLESAAHPLTTLDTTAVHGLPASIADGTDYAVTLDGDLTVKGTKQPVTFTGTVRRTGSELHVAVSATVSLQSFGIGPINLIGFVSVGDQAKLTIDAVAVDITKTPVPSDLAAAAPTTAPAGGPSFKDAVQPVLAKNCASCHNGDGIGTHAWTLANAGDAADVASGLALTAQSRYMPPWPASDLSLPFRHSTKLSDADVATLVDWAKTGGKLDVDRGTKITAVDTPGPQLRGDRELPMEQPYAGSPQNLNDYRCTIVDPKLTEKTFITGYQFVPDQREVVHHALAFRVKAAKRDALYAKDATDPAVGWQCYGGIGLSANDILSTNPNADVTQFMAWAPGQLPTVFPEGAGMQLDPGDLLVYQVHYHYGHAAPADRSKLVVDLAPPGAAITPVQYAVYLAPAEIPCPAGQSGPLCDRANVLKELDKNFGNGSLIANGLHLVCGTKPDDAKLSADGMASASCVTRVRAPGEVLAVFGHMHVLGKTFRMTLNAGKPDERIILDIPSWDFAWQMNFQPSEKLVLKKGDTIKVDCTWDSKLVTNGPRWVTWSEGTEDEMCYSALTTLPEP